MILAASQSLEIDLNGAVAANQCRYVVNWHRHRAEDKIAPQCSTGVSNNTTAVTMLAAPDAGEVNVIDYLSIYNQDTGPLRIFVQINDGGTVRIMFDFTLATLESMEYVRGAGTSCFTAAGARK